MKMEWGRSVKYSMQSDRSLREVAWHRPGVLRKYCAVSCLWNGSADAAASFHDEFCGSRKGYLAVALCFAKLR